MRPEIHPATKKIEVTCSCGHAMSVISTLEHDLNIEVCNQCHPFFTGKQKIIDTSGRVDRFNARFGKAANSKSS